MPLSQIIRVTAGAINQVNDAVIGMPAAPFGPGDSQFAGQLGKRVELGPEDIIYNSAIGNVYGGVFRYVQLLAGAAAPVVGQLLFWVPALSSNSLYTVTTAESGSVDAAIFVAGICLNNAWTPGNFSYIQDEGRVPIKFRGTLTDAGAIGSRTYAAAAGGADLGFADVLDDATAATFGTVSLMQGRYLGNAAVAPTNGGLKDVFLKLNNYRS